GEVGGEGGGGGGGGGGGEGRWLAEGGEGDQRAGQENEALEDEPPAGRPGDNALGCGDRPLPRGWRGHQACTSRPGSGTSLQPGRALTRARVRRSKPMPVGSAHGFPLAGVVGEDVDAGVAFGQVD